MTTQTDHATIRQVYKVVVENALASAGMGASMLRGLAAETDRDELAAVAELEASTALLHLRCRSGLTLSVQEWLDGPFSDFDAESALSDEVRHALVRRVATTAGGLWEAPERALTDAPREELLVGYMLISLCCVNAVAALSDTAVSVVLDEMFSLSDVVVAGDGHEPR